MVEAATGTSIGFDSNVNNGGVNNNEGNFNSRNRIKRTLSAVPSLYGKYKDSNGFIFRKRLRYIEDKISPIIKTLIPNFLVAHYVYVVGMGILGSIIIYPMRNLPYINALFLGCSSVTQAGLSPVDINTIYLYQQIVIYLICLFTAPPFIHTILVWFRLYWFEQYFDDIKEKSKLNFEMRKNATMLSHGTNNDEISNTSKLFRTISKNLFGKSSSSAANNNGESDSIAVDIDDEDNSYNSADYLEKKTEQVIGFGDLPKPQHARHKTIAAGDDIDDNRESPFNVNTHLDKNRKNRKLKKLRKLHKANKRKKEKANADANGNGNNDVVSSDSEDEESEVGSFDSQLEEQDANDKFYHSQHKQYHQQQQGKPNYLSWTPTIARNSNFVIMNREQREELGGVEYRALKLLSILLPIYYFGLHLIHLIMLVPYIVRTPQYVAATREVGVSPAWWAIFNAMSAINNCGLALTPTSLVPFNESIYVGLITSFFTAAGNTAFPMFLRLIIWIMYKTSKPLTLHRESLQFLLDHPRRCLTYLFPSSTTWWLTGVWFLLNTVDWVLYLAMDFYSSTVVTIKPGFRAFDGLFQAISARTAGFAYFNLAQVTPALQLSYVVLMYISIIPTAMAIRGTNVYEDQSLGIYDGDERARKSDKSSSISSKFSFVNYHLGKQLSFDLWFVVLMIFIICICERKDLRDGDPNFNIFSITFEIVSAYGTVGLSLGYPTFNSSLCTRFSVLSKLVVILTMIRGRHRGLPYTIDRAIMLQGIDVEARDQIEALLAIRRTDDPELLCEETKMTQDLIKNLNKQIQSENGEFSNVNHSISSSTAGGVAGKIFKFTKSIFSSILIINATNNRNNTKNDNLELQRELTHLAPRNNI